MRSAEERGAAICRRRSNGSKRALPVARTKAHTDTTQRMRFSDTLKSSNIFHFAGHGRSGWPSRSGAACSLQIGGLIHSLSGISATTSSQDNPPFLAYLSACSTGASNTLELLDEESILSVPSSSQGSAMLLERYGSVGQTLRRRGQDTVRDHAKEG